MGFSWVFENDKHNMKESLEVPPHAVFGVTVWFFMLIVFHLLTHMSLYVGSIQVSLRVSAIAWGFVSGNML